MSQVAKPYMIDVHQHAFPPNYKAALEDLDIKVAAMQNAPIPPWSPEDHIAKMDENGIATGFVSITGGFIYSRALTRGCNEYFARLISDHPGRFGAFAALPFPDIEGTLKELEYSIDQLKLDGVCLLTNIQGHYLADPEYMELFNELNRRKVIVSLHPNDPPCGRCLGKVDAPWAMIEFPLETTRAVGQMLYNGTLSRCPNIRFILPHAGGAIPFLAGRYSGYGQKWDGIALLKRQYYDTAGSVTPYAMRTVQALIEPSHILLGTDFGMAPPQIISTVIKGLREYDGFDKATLMSVERENALELFPRFKR